MPAFTVNCPVYGEPRPAAPARRSDVEAARTTNENRRHWEGADGLAAVSALTPGVRATLRNRARLEVVNNCFAAGLVRTLVADTVGTGPRLQMLTPDAKLNAAVEGLWRDWSAAADWPLTARVLVGVRYVAGETFGVYRDSRRLGRLGLPVTLDLRLVEPDQVAHPYGWHSAAASRGDDGVECGADGEVDFYHVLKSHPGDNRAFARPLQADRVAADDVVHWFQPDRPGQLRGYTPLAPALDLFAQLRRFTKATITAAEIAAMLAGVLESTMGPGEPYDAPAPDGPKLDTWDTVELIRGMLVTLPAGWKANQFKPEQPTTGYGPFVDAKLRECGRALNVPFGKMAGDHSKYNYSSGRMDDAPYWHDRDIERGALEAKAFNPLFYRWCDEARFALPALAAYRGRWWELRHRWQYDARPVTDPVKDATADERNLSNGSDSLSAIAARDGVTVEELVADRRRVKDLYERDGLPLPGWLTGVRAGSAAPAEPQPAEEGAARD